MYGRCPGEVSKLPADWKVSGRSPGKVSKLSTSWLMSGRCPREVSKLAVRLAGGSGVEGV